MSEIKFACPACQQHISADQGYAGMEINCPACSARMIVPGTPAPVSIPTPVPSRAYVPSPAAPPYAPPPAAASGGCPSCGAVLPRGAMICTQCGYNTATKQRIVGGRVVPLGAAMAPTDDTKWYATPYPYLGVVVLIFGALFLLGKSNPLFRLGYLLALGMYYVTLYVCVVVAAFREDRFHGILALVFPAFHFRFIFKYNDSVILKVMYAILVVLVIAIFAFKD
jgi:hypothetical protein